MSLSFLDRLAPSVEIAPLARHVRQQRRQREAEGEKADGAGEEG
jgi:hypothetical protein